MYERFTDRARMVMHLANQEAQLFNHNAISVEHILIGLLKEGTGVASTVLQKFGVTIGPLRAEIEKVLPPGSEVITTMGRLPLIQSAERAIEQAIEEAKSLGHSYVGTEHLLLGILLRKADKTDGAGRVLAGLGVNGEEVVEAVIELLCPSVGNGNEGNRVGSGEALWIGPPRKTKSSSYEAVKGYFVALHKMVGSPVPDERRDYLATTLLTGMLVDGAGSSQEYMRGLAKRAVEAADVLIEELDRPRTKASGEPE